MEKIFIHIPKTAGNTINKHCKSTIGFTKIFTHYPTYLNDNDDNNIDIDKLKFKNYPLYHTYYSFAFVRNPYDRLISAYNYLYNGGYHNKIDRDYCKLLKSYESFEKFINDLNKLKNMIVHLVPQHIFICNDNDDIIINFVGKYETLNQDINTLTGTTNINIPILNKSKKTYRNK